MALRCSLSSMLARDLLLIPGMLAHSPPSKNHHIWVPPKPVAPALILRFVPPVSLGLDLAVDGPDFPTTLALELGVTKYQHEPAHARGTRHSDLRRPDDNAELPTASWFRQQTHRSTVKLHVIPPTRRAVLHSTALGRR
jgi:hypothetical protein